MRIDNTSLSLRLCDAIYGNLWEPGGKGFCMAEALVIVADKRVLLEKLEKNKANGFPTWRNI